jgi:hypothetical protein
MKTKYQKQTEAILRKKGDIKRLTKAIERNTSQKVAEGLSDERIAEILTDRQAGIATFKGKISRHEQDIKNTEKRMQ